MENLIKKKYFILPGIALIAFFALNPFESTVVPEWTLEVRDADGDICGNMRVTEHWGHYSLYIDGATQTEDRNTDSLGYKPYLSPPLQTLLVGSSR